MIATSAPNQRAEPPLAEGVDRIRAFLGADVAGQGHDQMLARNLVRPRVVAGEDQHARVAVTFNQRRERAALPGRECQDSRGPMPGRGLASPVLVDAVRTKSSHEAPSCLARKVRWISREIVSDVS